MSSLTSNASVVLQTIGLKRHYGRHPAVDGVNLQVCQGEIYGFLGINGAGKTTTIRMLMGIIAAQAGSITFFGQTTRRTTVRLKRDIGYVSQDQNFYPWMTCEKLGRFTPHFTLALRPDYFLRLPSLVSLPFCRFPESFFRSYWVFLSRFFCGLV